MPASAPACPAPDAPHQPTGSAADHKPRFEEEAIPYMGRLFPAALRLTGNYCDAEDLIQETFAKAYLAFHQFSPGTNLRAWLHRIMINTYYSMCRKRGREPTQVLCSQIRDTVEPRDRVSQTPRSAEAEALDHLADSEVMRVLNGLPDSYKAVVYFADVEGYHYADIAEMMGTPLGTVMSRIHRGRQMLRGRLHDQSRPLQPTAPIPYYGGPERSCRGACHHSEAISKPAA